MKNTTQITKFFTDNPKYQISSRDLVKKLCFFGEKHNIKNIQVRKRSTQKTLENLALRGVVKRAEVNRSKKRERKREKQHHSPVLWCLA